MSALMYYCRCLTGNVIVNYLFHLNMKMEIHESPIIVCITIAEPISILFRS